jgi:hypothetical protein
MEQRLRATLKKAEKYVNARRDVTTFSISLFHSYPLPPPFA